MYRNKDDLCMQLFEILVVADLVRIFDKDIAMRIQSLYWYHTHRLHEDPTQKIRINIPEAFRKRPFCYNAPTQPELFVSYD